MKAAPTALSLFWAPLCAVGSHGSGGPNAQICLAVVGASIVPERPRVIVGLWKTNLTHDLVRSSGSFALTLLDEAQHELLWPLGIRSGREGPKLQGLPYALTPRDDPWFPGGVAAFDCTVLATLDAGDASFFLAAVEGVLEERDGVPLRWPRAQELLGPAFATAWEAKAARNRAAASSLMRWLESDG
ncbi:High molecular weight rubredoxin [bacterium HR29]|nr:High molecular weight rubredoxin [bacterium HR29]